MADRTEIWRNIPNYEGLYQVSDLGRVRSIPRVITTRNGRRLNWKGVILSLADDGRGHTIVALHKNGQPKMFPVHRLVLSSFVGPRSEGLECRHLDSNGKNNKLENLQWGTRSENIRDRLTDGGWRPPSNVGSNNPRSILTEKHAKAIRVLYETQEWTVAELANLFSVGTSTIVDVVHGRSWKRV